MEHSPVLVTGCRRPGFLPTWCWLPRVSDPRKDEEEAAVVFMSLNSHSFPYTPEITAASVATGGPWCSCVFPQSAQPQMMVM